MKKLYMLLLAFSIVLTACATDGEHKESNKETQTEQINSEEVETETVKNTVEETEDKVENSDGNSLEIGKTVTLGDFEVTVREYKVVEDFEGTIGLRITYDAKYLGEDKNTPGFALMFIGYQDGVETNDDFFSSEDVDFSNGQKTLKKGGEISGIQEVVGIDDIEKPLELEFMETISFDDTAYTTVIEDLSQYK